jgi:hypothetical protein
MGTNTTASGSYSFAMGYFTTASGPRSFAIGENNTASGDYSTAIGLENTSSSFNEMVVGHYATNYIPASTNTIVSTDRLFAIGNGTTIFSRSNAITVLKNGNMGIGNDTPTAKLQVKSGDVYVETIGNGVIIKSPNGSCWRLSVSNAGVVLSTSVACP